MGCNCWPSHPQYHIEWLYHNLFTHITADGHLDCFILELLQMMNLPEACLLVSKGLYFYLRYKKKWNCWVIGMLIINFDYVILFYQSDSNNLTSTICIWEFPSLQTLSWTSYCQSFCFSVQVILSGTTFWFQFVPWAC